MKRALICKDDKTSHGVVVLEGQGKVKIGGRPVARLNDTIWCPTCKGKFLITEGLVHCSMGGRGAAVEGMRTACGATLIASGVTDADGYTQAISTADAATLKLHWDVADMGAPTGEAAQAKA